MTGVSKLFVGRVVHRRLKPRAHAFSYRCFWMLLDLDELPTLDRSLWLFGHNRAAPLSFLDRDHGAGGAASLRGYLEQQLTAAGIDIAGGPIRILCMPRVAGYGFNPLSVYFCHQPNGDLRALIYEVNNTYRERHSYLIEVEDGNTGTVRQQCAKRFYVSPFMEADLTYDFRVMPPADTVSVVIRSSDSTGPVLLASLSGEARPLSDANLLVLLIGQPFLTLKVIAAIHWEALRLWLKRIAIRPKPEPPRCPMAIVSGQASARKSER